HPLRTGMIPPQLPGSPSYLRPGTPAIAKVLLDLGYTLIERLNVLNIGRNLMRTLSILIAAVAVLSLSSTFTATQAATTAGVTSTQSTTNTTQVFAAKKKYKKYGHCPPGQAKKFRC
ncbi:MAG TPA: hypothetical protein VIY07_05295, partial [Pseudolabrys sp.]